MMQNRQQDEPDVSIETDALSPGEARIEKLKAAPRSAFHFSLMGILGLMVGTSILVALPRGLGVDYVGFFGLWILLIYGCAPLVCWTSYSIIPAKFRAARWLVPVTIFAIIVVPAWIAVGLDGSLPGLVAGSLFFWLPQVACIAAVQYFLFSAKSNSALRRR